MEGLWRKWTRSKSSDESAGKFEVAFFESVNRCLYLSGLSTSDGGVYLLYSTIVKFLIITLVSGELLDLFSNSSSLDVLIDNINITLLHVIAVYKYKNMVNNKAIYKKLAASMDSTHFDIATPERREIYEFWLKNNDKYFKLLLTLTSCTVAVWHIYPLVDDVDYNLVVHVRVPFEYQSPDRYPLTYVLVLVAFHYISYLVICFDLKLQCHLIHLLCQFEVLSNCFENILSDCAVDFKDVDEEALYLNGRFTRKYFERLGDLAEQHKTILINVMNLRRVLSTPMLCQTAGSSMLICLVGYQVTMTAANINAKFLMSLLYLGCNFFELFLFCLWCDEIKERSELIREAVYSSGWERGMAVVPGVRARLLLVAARASRPLVLTAGGLYDLSLMSYTNLVKTSYSALTVLLRFRPD